VRVERRELDAAGRPLRTGEPPGPERRYPGMALLPATPADFDGDGFADLMLWEAPLPGRSVNALTEALASAAWPVRVRIHRYGVSQRRFEARAMASISFGIPVEWFLFPGEEGPIRLAAAADFDGDGLADFGCLTGPRRYTVWKSGTDYRNELARVLDTAGPIERLEFAKPLGEQRAATLALRTESALYILDPP